MADLGWPTLAGVALTLALAYGVYGFTGFGANLVAMPVLAQLLPLKYAVPMLVVFDLAAGGLLFARHRAHLDWRELGRLLPWLLAGMAAGVTLLAQAPEGPLLVALGVFVFGNAAWSLFAHGHPKPVGALWAVPAGLVGGTVTALYGTGGPIYTLYLARRIAERGALRATIGGLIFGNSLIRLVLFGGTGFYAQPGLVPLALAMLPGVLVGYLAGSHWHARAPAAAMRAIWWLLLAGGAGLVWRGLHAG